MYLEVQLEGIRQQNGLVIDPLSRAYIGTLRRILHQAWTLKTTIRAMAEASYPQMGPMGVGRLSQAMPKASFLSLPLLWGVILVR
jgi:hypothetical protein